MAVHGDAVVGSYETDRSRFIGRGRTVAHPAAMENRGLLSDSEGPVLDPIVAIRSRIEWGRTVRRRRLRDWNL